MLIAAFSQYFFGISIFVSSLFLILLVLVQRGRGGGLTGALGGPGGQSAFGTKAGDLFTRITVGVAVVWILLCAASVYFLKARALPTFGEGSSNTAAASGSIGGTDSDSTESMDPLGTQSVPEVTGLGTDPLAPSETSASDSNSTAGDAEISGDEGLQLSPEPESSTETESSTDPESNREPENDGSGSN